MNTDKYDNERVMCNCMLCNANKSPMKFFIFIMQQIGIMVAIYIILLLLFNFMNNVL